MLHKANVSLTPQKVDVSINVTKIVKYSCITSVLIIAIIFGTRTYINMPKILKENN